MFRTPIEAAVMSQYLLLPVSSLDKTTTNLLATAIMIYYCPLDHDRWCVSLQSQRRGPDITCI